MKLTVRNSSPPAGTHEMTLFDIEEGIGKWSSPIYCFHFRVTEEGGCHGRELSHTTGTQIKVGNALHTFLGQLFGRELTASEQVDPSELIGATYHVEVKERSTRDGSLGRSPYILYLEPLDEEGDLCGEVAKELFEE